MKATLYIRMEINSYPCFPHLLSDLCEHRYKEGKTFVMGISVMTNFCTKTTCHFRSKERLGEVCVLCGSPFVLCHPSQYEILWQWNDINPKFNASVQNIAFFLCSGRHTEDVRTLLNDVFGKLQNETTMEIWNLVTLEWHKHQNYCFNTGPWNCIQ